MTEFPNVETANQYAEDVVKGRVIACKWVRLACKRHLNDLKNQKKRDFPFYFDEKSAERVCKFVQLLPHTKGEWAYKREMVTLEPWQKFAFSVPFGWKRKKDDTRRYRECYYEIPRKNGKSIIAAGVGLYMFAIDDEFGAEIYSGATTEKQAWEVFRPARLMVKRSPMLIEAKGIEVNASNMNRPADGARFEPLIGSPGDGASPSCALIDEYHEHPTPVLYDTMATGMGSRKQPLIFIITTAGDNIAGPCFDKRGEVMKVLEGSMENNELWGLIYTIDEDDDWKSVDALRKANPNMGVSVYEDYLIARQDSATKNANQQNIFKTKHLNIWVSARAAWMNMELWNKCSEPLRLEDFEGQDCFSAIDIAAKIDICAEVKVFPREIEGKKHYYAFARFWLPDETIYDPENRNAKAYQKWLNQGFVQGIDGVEVDPRVIRDCIIEDSKRFSIREVPHDPWNAQQMAQELMEEGLLPVKIPQTVLYLSPAMKELEAAIKAGRFHHDGNPVLTWMMSNVTCKEDANENIFPRKEKPEHKIDGAVALIMAIGRAMADESDYVSQGFIE